MAQVRASCPLCGVIEVACPAVTVVRRSWETEAEYHLACPVCDGLVRGLLRPNTVLQLVSEGARLVDVPHPAGAPLTPAEVEGFAAAMSEPGVLERELAELLG